MPPFSLSRLGSWCLQRPKSKEQAGTPIYERPLGLLEQAFYWDSVFKRVADTLQHVEVGVDPFKIKDAFGYTNVSRTWVELKQQFPLLGARIEERDEDSIYFVVEAENLHRCLPGEIIFLNIASAQEAQDIMESVMIEDKALTNNFLARIYILKRTDTENVFHVFIHVAHSITDGMSNITIMKTFFNEMCRQNAPPLSWDLTRQLALSEASENLYPQLKMSIAKQRWRLAVAKIISANRMDRFKAGGHTIPRRVTEQTEFTPAASRTMNVICSPETTRNVLSNCRKNNITFGNAYPVIAQIATARLLLKRYLRGEISEDEWDFRKRQPMSSVGPLNLRPFLDQDWIKAGGNNHVCVAIGFFFFQLPMLPLGSASFLRPGATVPSYDSMIPKYRFLHRSRLIQDQARNFHNHPLFIELGSIPRPMRVALHKQVGLQWRKEKHPPKHLSVRPLSPTEEAERYGVFNNGGSSMGNVDLLLPRQYPVGYDKESNRPSLWFINDTSMLHCRPTELYLGASTSQEKLRLLVYWDNNVFDEAVVTEWLNEVKNAIEFYLGQDEVPQSKL
ncbi:hypothetical protein BDN70DRAFT_849389 [Pholiota conissans]|uniref:Condensation domain-containing protein n=1 Tax=Pholiota conissans TaxID=109636 RepID=A0A9P5ZF28_9AGAR|nr:hypothetical protein BDN70DRAFT_849389 [Pholiota conissans]